MAWLVVGLVATAGAPAPGGGADAVSQAASAGVEWLLGPGSGGSAGSDFSSTNKLYRVAADPALADRLLVEARRLDAEVPEREIPADLSNRRYLMWGAVDPLVKQLIRDRCRGRVDERAVEALRALVTEHHEALIGRLPLHRRIVAAYYLDRAGVDCCGLYASSLSAVREALASVPEGQDLASDPFLLYAVTHVVFTRSGYYDHYLDPAEYQPELKAIRTAAASMVERDLQEIEIDIAAELVVALKLLRAPDDPTVRTLRQRVAAAQAPDGSWGATRGPNRHTTLVCTLALLEFAPEFRGDGSIRCAP